MKFSVTFKTPDCLDSALEPYIDTHCENCEQDAVECEACDSLAEAACDKIADIKNVAEKFIKWGEYVTIEFDTEAKTASVVPARK